MRLSRRLPWEERPNRLAAAALARRAGGGEILDLTETNPTRVGLDLPLDELADILARAARHPYRPDPRGLPEAREALAAALSSPTDTVDPGDLLLTASTSEAYGFLLKLLADPGDEILMPVPSYPLLDHLAALEGVHLAHLPLSPERDAHGRRFALDAAALAEAAIHPTTRALLVVSPNNPTGLYLRPDEQDAAAALCATHGLALVSDEVFADYPLDPPHVLTPAAARTDVLAFSLGGLSKSAALPHWKLAWIRVGGPAADRRRALAALELIADTYLSVATPVQKALPDLLGLAPRLRLPLLTRLRANLAHLTDSLTPLPALELLTPEGGWSAVLRIPRLLPDEDLALALLDRTSVLVQPGYLFDFEADGYLVLSLLPHEAIFRSAIARLVSTSPPS